MHERAADQPVEVLVGSDPGCVDAAREHKAHDGRGDDESAELENGTVAAETAPHRGTLPGEGGVRGSLVSPRPHRFGRQDCARSGEIRRWRRSCGGQRRHAGRPASSFSSGAEPIGAEPWNTRRVSMRSSVGRCGPIPVTSWSFSSGAHRFVDVAEDVARGRMRPWRRLTGCPARRRPCADGTKPESPSTVVART